MFNVKQNKKFNIVSNTNTLVIRGNTDLQEEIEPHNTLPSDPQQLPMVKQCDADPCMEMVFEIY